MRRDQVVRSLHVSTVANPGSNHTITLCGICAPILGKGLILVLNVPSVLPEETTWTVTWRENIARHRQRLRNDWFDNNSGSVIFMRVFFCEGEQTCGLLLLLLMQKSVGLLAPALLLLLADVIWEKHHTLLRKWSLFLWQFWKRLWCKGACI